VKVDARVVQREESVRMPARFPYDQSGPSRLQSWNVIGLVGRVGDGEVDVDDGRQSRY
jgi:hypothetical protein